jgi:hypothetical protein
MFIVVNVFADNAKSNVIWLNETNDADVALEPNRVRFQRNRMDKFIVTCPNVGDVRRIR